MVKYISPKNILFVSKMSSRDLEDMPSKRLQDMSSRRFQHVFSITIFCLPRRLEDIIKTSCEMSSRRLGRRKIVTLKTS